MQQRPIWIQESVLRQFPPAGGYLAGISGGRDSVTLLEQLTSAGYRDLTICHLNHRLRGRSSTADAFFVEKLAEQYGFDFALGSANVRGFARQNKISVETAARAARYQFFADVAKTSHRPVVFLGHHADDLVETFLINLIRGAGLSGLSALREISQHRVGETQLTVVRPLLRVWRSDIDRFIRSRRLQFREDASNAEFGPIRNRIRHRVVPYLEKTVGRKVRQNIWRAASIAAEEDGFFETLLPQLDQAALAIAPLRKMPLPLQRRALRKWLRAAAVRDIGFEVIERVRLLLDRKNKVAKTNLSQDRHVRRRAGKIFIE